jgi:hypothetical protein
VARPLDLDQQERHASIVAAVALDRLEQIAGGVVPAAAQQRRRLANAAAASSQRRWRSATSARSISARVNCGSAAITVSSERAAPSRSPAPSCAWAIR